MLLTWHSRRRLHPIRQILILLSLSSCVQAELIGYWPLNGDGQAIVGESGVLINGPAGTLDRNGVANGALEFDGFEQYVEVAGGGGLDGILGGTISLWASWTGLQDSDCCGTHGAILSRQANGVFSDNILALSDPDPEIGSIVWRQFGGPAPALITSLDPVGDDQWRHIAVTFGPAGSELFVDGISQGTAVGGVPLHANPEIPLAIGAWSGDGAGFASARLDDVAFFDDLLSAGQIAALADGSATPSTVGPGTPIEIVLAPGVLPATIHSVSSNLGDGTGFNRRADYIVNGFGLIDNTHSTNPEGTMWLNKGAFAQPNDFDPQVTFDLGSVRQLDSVKVWNYNETLEGRPELLGRGVAEANIEVAGEDLVFTTLIAGQAFDIAPGDATVDFGQVIDLLGIEARYVRFNILGNHGGDNEFVGLSEVQFFGPLAGPGDFDADGSLTVADLDALSAMVRQGTHDAAYDLNGDNLVNDADRTVWVRDLKGTWVGDSNLDGEFNSGDFVQVFQRGQFEDGIAGNSNWSDGDWDGDQDFTTSDFVAAFQDGGFEIGPRPQAAVAAVPEPGSCVLFALGLATLSWRRRDSQPC